jgi:hypothetical protein
LGLLQDYCRYLKNLLYSQFTEGMITDLGHCRGGCLLPPTILAYRYLNFIFPQT